MKKLIYILFVTVLFLGCSSEKVENVISNTEDESAVNNTDSDYNLLFIGNSLTYSNNLPDLVKAYALSQGTQVSVTTIAKPNYALIDHWNEFEIQSQIETGNFDFVIVQQGPSSQPLGRGLLLEYGGYISELCNSNNAKLAYFMVWPSLVYYHTFDGVIESYTLAANANNDILCPVGAVWKSYFDQTKDYSYYGSDGFHPSLAGSEVAASVIYEALFID